MALIVEKKLTTKNCYKNSNNPKFIVIHETDNTDKGADATRHAQALANGNLATSVHYFVDDKKAIQTLEHKHGAWAVGVSYGTPLVSGVTNYNSINIEICVNSDGNYTKARANCIELVKILMSQTGIPASRVIRHYDAKKKTCPRHMVENSSLWTDFKNQLTKTTVQEEEYEVDKLVVYNGDGDMASAAILADYHQCGIMKKAYYDKKKPKVETVYTVGGKAGTDRFDTFKEVAGMLK